MQTTKERIRKVLEQLPENASVNDIRYELNDALQALAVEQQIELGLQASREGRVVPHAEVKKRYLHS
jgi:predicted transcriptional regulator